MNIKVLYFSKSGNTRKLAEAIAEKLNTPTESIPPAYPLDNVKVLFLGSGVYGGKIDQKMVDFIKTLDNKKVKNVALFGTAGSTQDSAIQAMKQQLTARGINVLDESYLCLGKFFLFFKLGHPNAEEIKGAQEFAEKVVKKLEAE
jgi:flavodoxin